MRINKISSYLCVVLLCSCLILLSACKDSKVNDFDVESATNVITKLETEDDAFFNIITSKYQNDVNSAKLTTFITTIGDINESTKSAISNFTTYKSAFGSSEYANVFSYGEDFFKYEKDNKLIDVSFTKGLSVSVEISDENSVCDIEIKMIEEEHYAVRYFIKESNNEYGEEILYYFKGSAGRLRSRSCIETKSTSIFEYEDFSNFALDEGSGYYFFT